MRETNPGQVFFDPEQLLRQNSDQLAAALLEKASLIVPNTAKTMGLQAQVALRRSDGQTVELLLASDNLDALATLAREDAVPERSDRAWQRLSDTIVAGSATLQHNVKELTQALCGQDPERLSALRLRAENEPYPARPLAAIAGAYLDHFRRAITVAGPGANDQYRSLAIAQNLLGPNIHAHVNKELADLRVELIRALLSNGDLELAREAARELNADARLRANIYIAGATNDNWDWRVVDKALDAPQLVDIFPWDRLSLTKDLLAVGARERAESLALTIPPFEAVMQHGLDERSAALLAVADAYAAIDSPQSAYQTLNHIRVMANGVIPRQGVVSNLKNPDNLRLEQRALHHAYDRLDDVALARFRHHFDAGIADGYPSIAELNRMRSSHPAKDTAESQQTNRLKQRAYLWVAPRLARINMAQALEITGRIMNDPEQDAATKAALLVELADIVAGAKCPQLGRAAGNVAIAS